MQIKINNKYLIILGVLVIIGGILLLINISQRTTKKSVPSIDENYAQVQKISDNNIDNYIIDNNFLYYLDREEFRIKSINLDTQETKNIFDLASITNMYQTITSLDIIYSLDSPEFILLLSISDKNKFDNEEFWYYGDINKARLSQINNPECIIESNITLNKNGNLFCINNKNQILHYNLIDKTKGVLFTIRNGFPGDFSLSNNQKKIIYYSTSSGGIDKNSEYIYSFITKKLVSIKTKYIRGAFWSPNDKNILFDRYAQKDDSEQYIKEVYVYPIGINLEGTNTSKTAWMNDEIIIYIKNDKELHRYNISTKQDELLFILEDSFENINFFNIEKKSIYFTADDYLYKTNLE